MRNTVKRTAAGAVFGGSLLVTGGLGIANAVPPNNANDQQVDLAIGNSSVLHDLNVNVAAQIANLLCGTATNATGTNGTEATANETPANPMANPTTTNAGDITPKARQVAAGQMPTTSCDSSQGVVSIETVIATMKPEVTHCARSWPSEKWWLRPGIATFTMVDDMIEAMTPTITENSRYQR